MAQINITLNTELLHGLFSKDGKDDAFSNLLETILNQVLEAQSTEQLGAGPYERTEERTAYRNGFRDRESDYQGRYYHPAGPQAQRRRLQHLHV